MVRIRERWAPMGLGISLIFLAAACAAPPPSPSGASASMALDGLALPGTVRWPAPPATPPPCAGVGLDAVLHGDPTDPAITWLQDRGQGGRIEVSWPVGFRARFEPTLVVIDLTGRVVQREGDLIDGGCVEGDGIVLGYP